MYDDLIGTFSGQLRHGGDTAVVNLLAESDDVVPPQSGYDFSFVPPSQIAVKQARAEADVKIWEKNGNS
jgi:hypothetical protein